MDACKDCGIVKENNLYIKKWFIRYSLIILFIIFFYITIPSWGIYKIFTSNRSITVKILFITLILFFFIPFTVGLFTTETHEKAITQSQESIKDNKIKIQFSPWDGSHYKLTKYIKNSMNDPNSYEHVQTTYWEMQDYLIVSTIYRGTNIFGIKVTNTIKAKVSLNGDVLEITEIH